MAEVSMRAEYILEHLNLPIYCLDKEWKYIYLNKSAEEMHRKDREELIGRSVLEIYPDYSGSELYNVSLRAVSTCEPIEYEGASPFSERYVKIAVIPTVSGKLVYCAQDITKQKEYECRLEEETSKLHQLIEICPYGIYMIDNHGMVSHINSGFLQLYLPGCKKSEFIGNPAALLAEALGCNWANSATHQALQGEIINNRFQILPKTQQAVLITTAPVTGRDGQVQGAMTIVMDITEFENLKNEIARIERLHVISQMAAGVAHEVRNPMTVIKGYLQMFRQKEQTEASCRAEQYDMILNELDRVETIITDFLSLAKSKVISLVPVDLNSVIQELVPLISADAMKNNVNFTLRLAEKLPELLLDRQEIKQVILNLARNGIEAIRGQGSLTICTENQEQQVVLAVSDTGCGIPPELMNQIYNPFFTTKDTGTGLGLSVCASIVEHYAGKIEVQSEEGKGTVFTITFPLRDDRMINDVVIPT
jgi:two-component system, sporulation sensor kinase E